MQVDPTNQRILLNHLFNARDLGNMPIKNGGITLSHRFVRSDAPDTLTREEADKLLTYPIDVIIDLRSPEEALAHKTFFRDNPNCTYYNLPLLSTNPDDLDNDPMMPMVINNSLGYLYVWIFENSRPLLAKVLRTIIAESPRTILFHCMHGKDRTGIITAILYSLAGVSRENIISNYAISYSLILDLVKPLMAKVEDNVRHIYRSDASNMEMLLNHIDQHYEGSMEKYLLTCGLSEEEINELSHVLTE